MGNDINSKNAPNQMRVLLKRMRDNSYVVGESTKVAPKKEMSVRDMLKITRNLNEQALGVANKKTAYDQKTEEEKFNQFFSDLKVHTVFGPLEITDNYVFWSGTVNGIITFTYSVSEDESTNGVAFKYDDDFSPDNPENDEIVGRIKSYYDTFYKYWSNNILQK